MAIVWVPSMMRDLTGGLRQVEVRATTVAEAVDALEKAYPGTRKRLCQGDRLKPALSVTVDGALVKMGLRARLGEESKVGFVPTIAGG